MNPYNIPGPKHGEHVTAVMLTGHDPARFPFAKAALRCFLEQSYRDRELLIINQSQEYDLLSSSQPMPGLREISVPYALNHGEMWNEAIKHVNTPWVTAWDDDDWHHPHRLAFQMAHRVPGHATLFRRMLFVDLTTNLVGVLSDEVGFSGPMLFPRPAEGMRFEPIAVGADSDYFLNYYGQHGNYVMMENDADDWPGAALYVRFWHGGNNSGVTNYEKLLEKMDQTQVTDDHSALLQAIMPDFYQIGIDVKPTEAA